MCFCEQTMGEQTMGCVLPGCVAAKRTHFGSSSDAADATSVQTVRVAEKFFFFFFFFCPGLTLQFCWE